MYKCLLSLISLILMIPPAHAQQAGFVLFGEAAQNASTAEQQFVHPISSPFYHEDSFVTTDVRAWFLSHDVAQSSVLGGGNVKGYAAQIRLALTNSLQLVAYKDGFLHINTDLVDEDGPIDIAAGLKWNFLQDWENQFHAAIGAGYEFKTGDGQVLQNDNEWRLWLSANKGFGRLHLGATANFILVNNDTDSLGNADRFIWHVHMDYYACNFFSPVVEINGYFDLDSNGSPALPEQLVDVANVSADVSESVITVALGGEIRPCQNVAARFAYETPLTKNADVFGYCWTLSLLWSF